MGRIHTAQPRSFDPMVGDGVTVNFYSDRVAATIVWRSEGGKVVTVQRDIAERTDSNGMSDAQTYEFHADPNGATEKYSLRKNGDWIVKGDSISQSGGGRSITPGRHHYHDYSF